MICTLVDFFQNVLYMQHICLFKGNIISSLPTFIHLKLAILIKRDAFKAMKVFPFISKFHQKSPFHIQFQQSHREGDSDSAA